MYIRDSVGSGGGKDCLVVVGSDGCVPGVMEASRLVRASEAALVGMERFGALGPTARLILSMCVQIANEEGLVRPAIKLNTSNGPAAGGPGASTVARPLWYELFLRLDADLDGRVAIDEFVSGMRHILKLVPSPQRHFHDAELRVLAEDVDVNASGYLEWSEWAAVALMSGAVAQQGGIECVAPEPLATCFRLLDRISADGVVTMGDLLALVEHTESSHAAHSGLLNCELADLRRILEHAEIPLGASVSHKASVVVVADHMSSQSGPNGPSSMRGEPRPPTTT
eukprot:NODE_15263_length_1060_cov_2.498392.p1 GENE.NODE_15263_length_1060_cov_2.498392~~NODE_15263_length_1060_cov_2.498392.p1  ORF type:complete len:283 (+),score=70.15 NODE_15263_length_1060_cov_2.498392:155-1003(+)